MYGHRHLRHQFNLYSIIFLKVILKVLFFNITQKFTNSLVQLSIFFIDLFVGTYRLSSNARLEAFVIQTKLNYNPGMPANAATLLIQCPWHRLAVKKGNQLLRSKISTGNKTFHPILSVATKATSAKLGHHDDQGAGIRHIQWDRGQRQRVSSSYVRGSKLACI